MDTKAYAILMIIAFVTIGIGVATTTKPLKPYFVESTSTAATTITMAQITWWALVVGFPIAGDDAESVADVVENHPLVQLVGDHAKARILVALYTAAEPLNPHRIVERAGLGSNSTWYRHKDDLLETGLIV